MSLEQLSLQLSRTVIRENCTRILHYWIVHGEEATITSFKFKSRSRKGDDM